MNHWYTRKTWNTRRAAAAGPRGDAQKFAEEVVGTVFDNAGASHETLKATMIERIADAFAATASPTPAESESPILAFDKWLMRYVADHSKLTQQEYGIAYAAFIAAHPGEGPLARTMNAASPESTRVAGEQELRFVAAENVANKARAFCEELQEDADGVPQLQLSELNEALDGWEAYPDARESFDDSEPLLAALASLIEDGHATDHQRRVARLALIAIQNHEDELDKELRRWQDGIRDKMISLGVPDSKIDGVGCDSGDPLDFTLAEVMQGCGYFIDQLEELRGPISDSATRAAQEIVQRVYGGDKDEFGELEMLVAGIISKHFAAGPADNDAEGDR